jgi:predicted transcriptional regulator
MTPQQVFDYLDAEGISRSDFANKLGITQAAMSAWGRREAIAYDRQCQIEKETNSKLVASWDDAPKDRRPEERAA